MRQTNAGLKLSLNTTTLFDFPTIRRLAKHLTEEYNDVLAASLGGSAQAQDPAVGGSVKSGAPPGSQVLEETRIGQLAEDLATGKRSLEQALAELRSTQ